MVRTSTPVAFSLLRSLFLSLLRQTPFSYVANTFLRGGAGVNACASLLNNEFERVIYKVVYGFRTTILNLYMVNLNIIFRFQSSIC